MKLREKLDKIRSHPATKESMRQLKPKKTLWSLAGVALFFIVPEIVALIWGSDITAWTQMHLTQPLPLEEEYKYKAIEMLFGEPSYLNLLIGIALFVWAFF
jgi:hypothetical protein